jgi:formylglycine-generating enzyme required for sulfatase activity
LQAANEKKRGEAMSKQAVRTFYLIALMTLIVSACAPKSLVTPTEAGATEPSATEAPATEEATEAATEPPALVTVTVSPTTIAIQPSPTLITFDLSAPPMEVGSTFTFIDGNVVVAVPEGEFIMGHGGDDDPVHTVFLDEFWIYRTEVSNRSFALCVALGQCTPPDPTLNPYFDSKTNPRFLNWDQADAYCKMVKGRLPTEAEWEKAARGPDGNIYPWGKAAPSCTLANIGRCNPGVTPVNGYAEGKSYYDALNMAGNVFEWVADWYNPNYYSISPTENPAGPETGSFRSVRSAGLREDSFLAESARRFRFKPVEARNDLGFRCVVESENLLAFAPWCQSVAYVGADQGGGAPSDVVVPPPDCPSVGGSSAGYCNTSVEPKLPAANLNFNPDPLPASALFTVPGGCSLDSTTADPNDYYCTSGGVATIQAQCTVPPPPAPATCPAGYTQNGNVCEWTGGGTDATACLPGVTYDPLTQCCGSTPGVGDSFTLCPADAPYYSGGVCVPWPSSDFGPLITINVNLGTCGTGGDNGNSCTPINCIRGQKWCQSQCACIPQQAACN